MPQRGLRSSRIPSYLGVIRKNIFFSVVAEKLFKKKFPSSNEARVTLTLLCLCSHAHPLVNLKFFRKSENTKKVRVHDSPCVFWVFLVCFFSQKY